MDDQTTLQVLYFTTAVFALLVTISEMIGWSDCKANSITEFLFCRCKREEWSP